MVDHNVIVGYDTSDDAGVYRVSRDLALVQTVDFFTPIVDDPYTFGAIAAANSLSDVYAMGGRPMSALSIVCYPGKGDLDVLTRILVGGAEKMREAGCVILGGHSVNDDEIKFGYSVTGSIHPDRVWTNSGARVGDALVFTKRLGTGVVATALKRGLAAAADVVAMIESMLLLNRAASEALPAAAVNACTDITGFGFLGHAREMADGSGVTLEVDSDAIRFLPGAVEYARQGAIPGGLKNNREYVAPDVEVEGAPAQEVLDLLYDPQTSGGLLVSLPEADAELFLEASPESYRVGRVSPQSAHAIRIL